MKAVDIKRREDGYYASFTDEGGTLELQTPFKTEAEAYSEILHIKRTLDVYGW